MTAAVWHVYILRCGDGSLYTGIARDVEARLAQHASGRGARYTRGRGPLALVHVEAAANRSEALRREAAIRRLGRAGKEALAAGACGGRPAGARAGRAGTEGVGDVHALRWRPRRSVAAAREDTIDVGGGADRPCRTHDVPSR